MRTVYLNGAFVPESEAKLSIYDLSVMQAAAAFEMTRSFNGKHFKLAEHLSRLERSCQLLAIPFTWDVTQLSELCWEVSRLNPHGPGEEHRLLIVISPGCAPMYKDLDGVIPHPFLYIADFPLRYTVKGFSKYFTEGVHCVTSKIQQVPDVCVPSAAKHRSRLHFHLAQMQAPEGTWPIMVDHAGMVSEAPGANVFGVWRGEAYFVGNGCLWGISALTVQEWFLAQNRLHEPLHKLYRADELWLTGTPFCMLPVVSLDGKPIGDGQPGPIFKQTLAKWSEMVGVDIQRQIEQWDSQG